MYKDYPSRRPPFEPQLVQTKSQWTNTARTNPICQTQQSQLFKDFSDELNKRVAMHKKNQESMTGPSIEMIKRKFETDKINLQQSSSSGSYSKSSQIINSSLEETYWAQWKPTPTNTSSNWTDLKNDSFTRGRFDGKMKLLDEKALRILRKPMDMLESNSSEGDKNIQGKLYLYNPCDDYINESDILPGSARDYQQPVPTFTMSMPNYHSIFYYGADDHKYQERVKPCRRKEAKQVYYKKDDFNQEVHLKCRRRRRAKSVEKKLSAFEEKYKETKPIDEIPCLEECPKNRVRFSTKKCSEESNDDESDTYCSAKDSTRTIDGYHGDVDTESYQVGEKISCYYDSYEEGQGDLETDSYEQMRRKYTIGYDHEDQPDADVYGCRCNYCVANCRCFQSEEEDSYVSKDEKYHRSYIPVYRNEEDVYYPNNYYRSRSRPLDPSSSSLFNNAPQKDSSHSSTSKSERNGILKGNCGKVEILKEKSCGTPAPTPKTACACNTDAKICVNRSCETLDKITKEKKSGEDSPCCLKTIVENSENIPNDTSSSSKSSADPCKCCNEAYCHDSSTTSNGIVSSESPKSSSLSSKDTVAVVVDSSKDEIQDEESFPTDEDQKPCNAPRRPDSSCKPKNRSTDLKTSGISSNPCGSIRSNTSGPQGCKPSTDDSGFTPDVTMQNQDSGSMSKSMEGNDANKSGPSKGAANPYLFKPSPMGRSVMRNPDPLHSGTVGNIPEQNPGGSQGSKQSKNGSISSDTKPINDSALSHVHYDGPKEEQVGKVPTRDASVSIPLQHGRSFDGVRHYKSQENRLTIYRVGTKENQGAFSTRGLIDERATTISRPFMVLSSEAKNSIPAVPQKSLLLQRSPRSTIQTRPALKGHTYTLKSPTSSGIAARSPKRKR